MSKNYCSRIRDWAMPFIDRKAALAIFLVLSAFCASGSGIAQSGDSHSKDLSKSGIYSLLHSFLISASFVPALEKESHSLNRSYYQTPDIKKIAGIVDGILRNPTAPTDIPLFLLKWKKPVKIYIYRYGQKQISDGDSDIEFSDFLPRIRSLTGLDIEQLSHWSNANVIIAYRFRAGEKVRDGSLFARDICRLKPHGIKLNKLPILELNKNQRDILNADVCQFPSTMWDWRSGFSGQISYIVSPSTKNPMELVGAACAVTISNGDVTGQYFTREQKEGGFGRYSAKPFHFEYVDQKYKSSFEEVNLKSTEIGSSKEFMRLKEESIKTCILESLGVNYGRYRNYLGIKRKHKGYADYDDKKGPNYRGIFHYKKNYRLEEQIILTRLLYRAIQKYHKKIDSVVIKKLITSIQANESWRRE